MTTVQKAQTSGIDGSMIPQALRQWRQWVLWQTVHRSGKPTKEPRQANGWPAKSNDPSTWTTFDNALKRFQRGGYDGLGFMFAADDPFVGIDLDGCRNPETGEVAHWAQKIIDTLDTYAEVSPSGSGVKLVCIAKWPLPSGKNKKLDGIEGVGGKEAGIEVYGQKRYFAITGRRLDNVPTEPQERQQQIEDLAREHWPMHFVGRENRSHGHAPAGGTIALARQKLATIGPAVSGQNGHGTTYRAACELFRYGLSREQARELLLEYNATCEPPWTDAELEHKLDDAEKAVEADGKYYSSWANANEPWPEIVPFDELQLPAFPTEALPDVLRKFVEAESHATQTPADLAALLALAVCSAAIARRVVVEPRPGWQEPVNLFVSVLLEPGNRKSAVFADAMRPLREIEGERIEAARPAVAREQSERRQAEARLKKLEKLAAEKGDAEARHEAGTLAVELAQQAEPALPRLLVDDATAEKLGIMLAEQGGRIASMSPEGGVFDLMAGLYSKNGIPQFGVYLMGHSGDDLVSDRVSRKAVYVVRPALTCGYAMQPQVIRGLAENPAFRGRGLLARFLYAFPRSWIGSRQIAAEPVPHDVREAYRCIVRSLASLDDEWVLGLTDDALTIFQDFERQVEAMLADDGAMEAIRDWGGKLAGASLRLAAVLHCVGHGVEGRIAAPSITAAIAIGRYLVPHAAAVLNLMQGSDGPDDDARYVLRWINRHGRRDFTKREAQQHGRQRFPRADDIDAALGELERRGYIRLRPSESTGPGRPASPIYDVNPAAPSKQNPKKHSQYSQNCRLRDSRPNCEHIESALQPCQDASRVLVTV